MLEFTPSRETRDQILKEALGRSGNLRSPTIQVGDTLYVGFNETIYDTL